MFKEKAQKWLNQEKERAKYALSDDSLIALAVGFPVSSAEDVIKQKQRTFNMVDEARRIVLQEVQSNPEALASMTIKSINPDDLNQIIDDIQVKSTELITLLNSQPAFNPSKPATNQVIEDFQRIIKNRNTTDQPLDILQEFEAGGLLGSDAIRDYFAKNPASRNPNQSIILNEVKEVRDRYYTINATKNDLKFPEDSSSIRIIDDNGIEIEDFFGADEISLDTSGALIVEGRTYQVESNTQPKRISSTPKTRIQAIKTSPSLIREEYSFEIWACFVLDLVEFILDKIEQLYSIIADWKASLSSLLSLINKAKIGFAVDFQGQSLESILNIKAQEILGSIIGDELLGASATFGSNGFRQPRRVSLCDINKEKYCNIKSNIDIFLADLDIDLGSIDIGSDFDFTMIKETTLGLEEYIAKIEEALNKINTTKLKAAVCSFVEKRIRATPKELTNAQTILATIALFVFPSIPQLFNSEKLDQLVKSLKRAGYDALSDLLGAGNISGFLNTEEVSYPGVVARCLEDYADTTESPRRSIELSRLARLARTKDDRLTVGRRVRDGMRLRLGKSIDIDNAELVSIVGSALIDEVRSE